VQKISEAIVAGSLEHIAQQTERLTPAIKLVPPYKPNRKQRRAQEAALRAGTIKMKGKEKV